MKHITTLLDGFLIAHIISSLYCFTLQFSLVMVKYQLVPMTLVSSTPPRPYTWKPWPIWTSYIVCFTTLCVGFCVIIEFIIRDCLESGCRLYGSPSPSFVSSQSYIVYNIIPTTLSVCFTLLWAVSHHDFLRLEPYFQMSAQEGALAQDSILLEYPYRFPLIIPFLALKRRYVINSLTRTD